MATGQYSRPQTLVVGTTGRIGSTLCRTLAADGIPLSLIAREFAVLEEARQVIGGDGGLSSAQRKST